MLFWQIIIVFFVLITILGLIGMIGCKPLNPTPEEVMKASQEIENKKKEMEVHRLSTFHREEFDGHTYIIKSDSTAAYRKGYGYMGMVHDPDCPCHADECSVNKNPFCCLCGKFHKGSCRYQ